MKIVFENDPGKTEAIAEFLAKMIEKYGEDDDDDEDEDDSDE